MKKKNYSDLFYNFCSKVITHFKYIFKIYKGYFYSSTNKLIFIEIVVVLFSAYLKVTNNKIFFVINKELST